MSKILEKICLLIIQWGSYLILFLPLLVYRQTLYPYIFPKVIAFQILVEIILFFWLILIIQEKKYRPNFKNPLIFSLTIFTGILILTMFTGVDISRSFFSTQERMTGVFTIIHFYFWFLILTSVFKNWRDWKKFIWVSLISSFLVGLYGLGQMLGFQFLPEGGVKHGRLFSTLGNAIYLSVFAMLHIFLAGFLALIEKKWFWKGLAIFLIVFNLVIMLLGATRGVMLAFGLSLFLFLFFLIFTLPFKKTKIALVFLVIIGISSVIFLFTQGNKPWISKAPIFLQQMIYFENHLSTRIIGWQVTFQGFKEKPILGWGWENHDVLFNKYYHSHYLEKGVISIGIWRDRSHNQVMDILALTGILGILAYFAVFISLFWLLFRKIKKEAVLKIKITVGILGLMFMAYFVQNLSAFDTPAPLIVFYFGLGLVYFITESKNLQIDTPTRNVLPSNAGGNIRITNKKTLLIILVIISFPFIIYKFNLQPFWQSNFSVKGALISQTDLKSGLIFFKKALEKSSFVSPEIRAQLVISVNEAKNKGIADQKTLTEGLEFGISEIEKSIKEHPLDVRNYLYLGKLYNIKGVYDPSYLVKSEKILKTALELSPKREEVLYELGWVKLLKGEYEEAIEIYKEILSSNENIKKSHWYLGLSYLVAEEYDKGIKEIEKAYDYYITYESPDMLLFIGQTYAKLEKYDQAISLCNTVLSRQPKNITAMSQKVIYLAKSGNKNEALKIIERVSKIDPETAKELKKIIDSL